MLLYKFTNKNEPGSLEETASGHGVDKSHYTILQNSTKILDLEYRFLVPVY